MEIIAGGPSDRTDIAVARKHENVYIDTSAYTAKRYPPELVAYMNSRSGRKKVMFGSNYPMVFAQQALKDLHALGPRPRRASCFSPAMPSVCCSGSE